MPLRSVLPIVPALLALAGAVGPAAASAATDALSPEAVSVLAGGCVNCHAPPAQASGLIPVIHGRDEAFLRARLMAFRAEAPGAATVMPRLTRAYSADQINALARWFSAQKPEATR